MTGSTAARIPVVVDTNLASAIFVGAQRPRQAQLLAMYEEHLQDRRIVLAFPTVAELRYGAYHSGWSERRMGMLERWISERAVSLPDDQLVSVQARMRAECRQIGHGLQERCNEADRWIAATAIRYNLPLASDDKIFIGVPRLVLLSAVRSAS